MYCFVASFLPRDLPTWSSADKSHHSCQFEELGLFHFLKLVFCPALPSLAFRQHRRKDKQPLAPQLPSSLRQLARTHHFHRREPTIPPPARIYSQAFPPPPPPTLSTRNQVKVPRCHTVPPTQQSAVLPSSPLLPIIQQGIHHPASTPPTRLQGSSHLTQSTRCF